LDNADKPILSFCLRFKIGLLATEGIIAAGDAGQQSLPRQGMFLAAMLPGEIQQGQVS
jgi:hypothetical protein